MLGTLNFIINPDDLLVFVTKNIKVFASDNCTNQIIEPDGFWMIVPEGMTHHFQRVAFANFAGNSVGIAYTTVQEVLQSPIEGQFTETEVHRLNHAIAQLVQPVDAIIVQPQEKGLFIGRFRAVHAATTSDLVMEQLLELLTQDDYQRWLEMDVTDNDDNIANGAKLWGWLD